LGYIALTALAINSLLAVVVTLIMEMAGVKRGDDQTVKADYLADEGDERVVIQTRHKVLAD